MKNTQLDEFKKILIENFSNFEIPCYIQKAKETRFHYIFDIILKDAKSLSKVNKLIKVLQLSLHNDHISMDKSDYNLNNSMQVPISIKIKKLEIEDLSYYDIENNKEEDSLKALIGINEDNQKVYHDFEKDGNLFIIGDDQTGKTTLINTIIESISENHWNGEFALIDSNLKHVRWKGKLNLFEKFFSTDSYYDSDLLSRVIITIVKKHNRAVEKRGKPVLLIINGLHTQLSFSNKKYIADKISRILKHGFSVNVYTIISTTKSMLSSFDPDAFKTFNKRIALKLTSSSESIKVIGNKSACDILQKGVAIYKDMLTDYEQLLQIPSIDCERKGDLEAKEELVTENQSLSNVLKLQEKMQTNDTLNLLVQNFIEKKGKIQYLDIFISPESALEQKENSFCKAIKETVSNLENGEEIFFECQRIKTEPTIKIGNESIFIDKTTYSSFNELKYFYETLVAQNFIGNDIEYRDAFYMFVYYKYRNYLEGLYYDLKNKYDIAIDLDDDIITKMLNEGKSIAEVKNFVALKNFVEGNSKITSFDLCFENLGTKVEDKMKDIKQKQYLNNLLNLNKNHKSKTLHEIDLMSGHEFEFFVAELFEKMGYETEVTKTSGDQGVDVLARRNEVFIAIQAKCYSNVVGNHAIMEAVAGKQYYKANKCIVITNSTFTSSAKKLAEANKVELWDRSVLQEKIENL